MCAPGEYSWELKAGQDAKIDEDEGKKEDGGDSR
jgi:hypothetical protein